MKILLVEDDLILAEEIVRLCRKWGFEAEYLEEFQAVDREYTKRQADLILAFEPAEAVRSLSYLKKGGAVVVNRKAVQSAVSTLSQQGYEGDEMIEYLRAQDLRLYVVDGEELCARAGSPKVLNVALLGTAAASGALGITPEEMEREIRRKVKPAYVEMNVKALALGVQAEEEWRTSR